MGKVGVTASSFDLLHAGHILMFQECKKYCDFLIVLLQTNPHIDREYKHVPIQTVVERQIQLRAIKYIDDIIVYETEEDLRNLLLVLDYDVRIIGEDWKGKPFTGYDIPGHIQKVVYNTRRHNWSSSALREKLIKQGR